MVLQVSPGERAFRRVLGSISPSELLVISHGEPLWEQRRTELLSSKAVRKFLQHANSSVPAYRHAHHPLTNFSPLARADVLRNRSAYISELYQDDCSRFTKKTSGSTGLPIEVGYDLAGWYGINYGAYADICSRIPQIQTCCAPNEIGVVLVTDKPERGWHITPVPELNYAFFTRLPIDRTPDDDKAIVKWLRQIRIPLLHGKPGYLMKLMKMDLRVGRGRISAEYIIVSGEKLFSDQRAILQEWFGCKVYDAYAVTESGLVALECSYERGLHVFTNRIRLEVLRNNGDIRRTGAGELIVTSLVNWGMPFIRYRTGDFGVLRKVTCRCSFTGPTIVEMHGRERPQFETRTGVMKTAELDRIIGRWPGALIQIQQCNERHFFIRWELAQSASRMLTEVQDFLSARLGPVEYGFEEVSQLTSPGGKQRRYL